MSINSIEAVHAMKLATDYQDQVIKLLEDKIGLLKRINQQVKEIEDLNKIVTTQKFDINRLTSMLTISD